jgi:DNA-binding transcriptional ArsR family regulator
VTLASAAPVFTALGDPTRLGLVTALGERGPLSLVRLSAGLPVTRQAVAKHLGILESAGLVSSDPRGRERIWRLNAARLAEAGTALERASARWDAALERLRVLVETEDAGPAT